jgi:hypothetical protein
MATAKKIDFSEIDFGKLGKSIITILAARGFSNVFRAGY